MKRKFILSAIGFFVCIWLTLLPCCGASKQKTARSYNGH